MRAAFEFEAFDSQFQIPDSAESYQVIVPDLRYGETDKPAAGHDKMFPTLCRELVCGATGLCSKRLWGRTK